MGAFIDLTGHRFGLLTVIERGGLRRSKRKEATWRCRCACGRVCVRLSSKLRSGQATNCGCVYRIAKRLLKVFSQEHNAWRKAWDRCRNKRHRHYRNFGALGTRVSERWAGHVGFIQFLADMGPKPSPKHMLVRIDQSGHYEPGNCHWSLRRQRARRLKWSRERRAMHRGKNDPTPEQIARAGAQIRQEREQRQRRGDNLDCVAEHGVATSRPVQT